MPNDSVMIVRFRERADKLGPDNQAIQLVAGVFQKPIVKLGRLFVLALVVSGFSNLRLRGQRHTLKICQALALKPESGGHHEIELRDCQFRSPHPKHQIPLAKQDLWND